MATSARSYGTNTSMTVTNLHSLGDDLYWQSAAIDNAAGNYEAEIFLTIVTTTTAGDAAGTINVYLAGSTDGGTDYAGGATGTQGTYTNTANVDPKDLRFVGAMACDASETTARTYKWMGLARNLPEDFSFVLQNASGTPIASTGNIVEYRLVTYTSA